MPQGRIRLFALIFSIFVSPLVAQAATTEFRILFDSDNNAATGCTVSGLSGVDQVLITTVTNDDTTAGVTGTSHQTCTGGALSAPAPLESTGWPAGYQPASGQLLVETRVPFSIVGSGTPSNMRIGIEATQGALTHRALTRPDGSSVFFPAPSRRRHAVGAPGASRVIVLDGIGTDWTGLDHLFNGIAGSGMQGLRIQTFYGYANVTDSFLYFRFDVNISADAPFALDDEYTRPLGQGLNQPAPGVLANDGDPNNLPLTALPVSTTAHGSLTLNPDGSFTYSPDDPNSTLADTFQYKASNGTKESNPAQVTINVGNNTPPVITSPDSASVPEGDTAVMTVTATDAEGQTITFSITGGADGSAFSINPSTGALTFNAPHDFEAPTDSDGNNIYVVQVTATDTAGGTTSQLINVTVTNVNEDPAFTSPNAFSVPENTTAIGFVSATDPDGSSITYSIVGGADSAFFNINASSGALSFNSPRDFEAPADAGANNVYNVIVRANDGTSTVDQTISVTVTNVNEPPTITSGNAFSVPENTTAVTTVTTTDPEGNTITYSISGGADAGDFTINTTTGALSFNPAPNFEAPSDSDTNNIYIVQVSADDGPNTVNQTITVTVTDVNEAPTAVNDARTINEDGTINEVAPGVIANDSDPEGGALTASLVTGPSNALSFALNPNGSWNYQPNPNFNGSDSFTYTVSDGTFTSNIATVTITITPVNDEPTFTGGGDVTVNEDSGAYSATWATAISAGPADESAQTLTFNVTNNNNALFSTQPQIASNGTLTFTPAANAFGSAQVSVTLVDSGSNVAPNDNTSATVMFMINVTAVNDAPIVNAGATLTYTEGQAQQVVDGTVTVTDIDDANLESATIQISANFQAGADVLAFVNTPNITGNFVGDTLTLTGTDTLANWQTALRSVTYQSTSDDPLTTTRTITWIINDGDVNSAPDTSTITVVAVNDAPVLTVTGAITYNENSAAMNAATAANITDPDDTNIESATIQITGNFASGEDVLSFANTPNITGSFVGDTLTLTGTDTLANYIAALQAVQYSNNSENPSMLQRTLTWTVNDGTVDSNTQTTTIDVNAINDAPVNTLPAAQSTNEDTPLTLSTGNGNAISIADLDANPDDVQTTLNVTNGTVAVNPAAIPALTSLTGDGTNTVVITGTVAEVNAALNGMIFTPTGDYFGAASIQVVTDDLGNNPSGNQTDTDTLNITVNAVNDAPVLTVTGAVTHTEGGAATNVATAANITDVDDTNIESATIQITGNFASGQDVLSFVNTVNISGSFVGDTLTLTGSDTLANYIAALLSITYTNTSDTPSTLQRTITWTVNDGDVNSNTQTTTLDVTATNDAPVNTLPGAQATNEDTPLVLSTGNSNAISIADADANPDDVQVTLNVTNGTATVNPVGVGALTSLTGDGTNTVVITGTVAEVNAVLNGLTFNPTGNYFGAASIQVVTDDLGNNPSGNLTDTDTLNITVNAVNDAPVLTVTGAVTHTEGGAATNVATAANITDADDTNIESATIQITGNYAGAQDVLSFVNAPPIMGSFVGDTLTLTGSDTLANYIAALQAVQYTNTSDAPSTLQRTITWTVFDGDNNSNAQATTLDVTATNDAPVNTLPGAQATNEDTPLVLSTGNGNAISIADADANPDDVQVTLNVTNGTVTLNPSATGALTSLTGDGTATVVATGTVAEINAALDGMTFNPTLNYFGAASIQVVTDDLGNNPSGNLTDTDTLNITVNNVNDAPVLTVTGSSPTFTEGGAAVDPTTSVNITDSDDTNIESATIQITGNFQSGADQLNFVNAPPIIGSFVGDTLTLTGSDTLANYIAALNSITFSNTSEAPSTAQRTITWSVFDGDNNSNTQTTAVDVTAVNDGPTNTIPGGAPSTNEDTDLGGLVFSIADPDSGTSDIDVQLTVTNGVITLNSIAGMSSYIAGDGTLDAFIHFQGPLSAWNNALNGITFRPTTNFSGTATIQIVTDDLGNTGTGGALSDTDTLNITVNAMNDPPVNGVPGTQTFNEDTTLTFSSGNGNAITVADVDAAAGNLQVTLSTTAGTITLGGTTGLTVVGNGTNNVQATGNLTDLNAGLNGTVFSPTLNLNGAQTISMSTSDLGNTGAGGAQVDNDTINLSITAVNDAPVNAMPSSPNVDQDTFLTMSGGNAIQISDVDAGAGSVQVQLTATNGTMTLDGTVGLSFSVGDGTADATMTFTGTIANINAALDGMTFTPTPTYFGPATIQIVTDDQGNTGTGGAQSDTDTLNITVNQLNQAPVNTVPGAQTFNEDTARIFSAGNSNQISIADPDAGVAVVQVQLTVTNGVLSLNGTVGLSFVFADGNGTGTGDGTNDATMTFRGTIADINTALNGLVYTPNLNYNPTDTLTIVTNDLGNTGPGGPKMDTDNVTLNITAVNDAPVLTNPSSVNATEDVQFSFTAGNTISVTDADSGAGTNFQATLGVSSGTINVVAAGSAIVGGNNTNAVTITGTVTDVNSTLATTKYTGNLNFNGSDTLAVNVSDNGQTGAGGTLSDSDNITINVAAVNDAPVNTIPGTQTFNEDTTLTFSTGNGNAISVADVDVGGSNVTVTLTTTAGTMTFGSVVGLSGVTNNAATITGTGTLTNINNALQGLVFTPTLNLNGAQTISFTSSDNGNTGTGGTLTDNDTINLSITAVNDAPVITRPATMSVNEDTAFTFNGGNVISVADVDVGAGNIQVSLSVTNGTLSLSGTAGLSFVFSDGNGTGSGDGTADASMTFRGTLTNVNNALNNMTYTGNLNFNGSDTLNIGTNDLGNTGSGGALTDAESTAITVNAVNDAPVAQNKVFAAQAHMRINGLTGLLTGVTDADNGTGPGPCVSTTFTVASLTVVTPGAGTTANLDTNAGTFDFLPGQNFSGAATLNYTVQDTGCPGSATSAAATITINVATPIIYFVKSVAVGSANCTLGNECTLATAIPLATAATGRHIFISDANTHTPGLATTLQSGGHIMGQGVTTPVDSDGDLTDTFDDLFDIAPPSGTIARPSIAGSRPTVTNSTITLHNNSQARGFNVQVNGGTAVTATGRTGLRISDMNISTSSNNNAQWCLDLGTSSGIFNIGTITQNTAGNNGSGVRFATTTSTSTVTIGNISMQGTGQGFNGSSTGATNFSFGTVNTTGGAGVTVATSSGNFTFGNITSTTGAAVTTSATGTGDFTFTTVTSTTGKAVSVTTATGDYSFTAINANGAATGMSVTSLTAPGTFIVNGSGSTDGSGGTVQNCTNIGADLRSSANVTLKNMNFTNNGVGNGPGANCEDIVAGTTNNGPTNCFSNVSLLSMTNATLDNINASLSDQIGIDGQSVNGLTMTGVNVFQNGGEVGEDGVQMANLSGTVSISGSSVFKDNAANQFEVVNSTGTLNATVSNSEFSITNFPAACGGVAPSPGNCTANSGLYFIGTTAGSSTMNLTITNSLIQNIYSFGVGLNLAGSAASTFNVGGVGTGNTFTNNGLPIVIGNTGTGTTTYNVRDNIITNSTAVTATFATTAISASFGANATRTGLIDNNSIGTNNAASTASGCFVAGCDGIQVTDAAAQGTHSLTVSNNDIYHVKGAAIRITSTSASTDTFRVDVTNNIANYPDDATSSTSGILVQDGNSSPNGVFYTCVEIAGNNIQGLWAAGASHKSAIRILATRAQQFSLTGFNVGTEYAAGAVTAGCTTQCTDTVGNNGNAADYLSQQNPLTITAQTTSGGSSASQNKVAASAAWTGAAGPCP